MVFPYVGAKNQILDCMTFEEFFLDIILVVRSKATGLWHDRDASLKPTVFFRRQDYGSTPVGKDLGLLLCGSSLEDFYLRVS